MRIDLNKVSDWLGKHRIAIATAILVVLCELTFFIPPQVWWFVWQRRLQTIATLLLGIINFLSYLSHFLPMVVYLVLAAIIGFLVGLVAQLLWKQKWWGKLIVIVALAGNIFLGLLLASFTNTPVGSAYATCEHFVSDTNAVRITAYPEYGILGEGHFFFLVTNDSGETWKQFMHFRHDDPIDPPCENIKSLDDQTFWV